ncbi:hypothetical protein K7887_22705 (plasmid) [Sutcliffiella horikoshii]|uniref:hypothetical protein n=1 Tax=Sutcliffiella horikoshii TaxID=79883 RepID=UPI001CBFFB04|nr:hypothetical protein [Sutcliffiella horikoshii]UAL49780.1 hypothetical protein K7887_22705 [Sutcliffiella horikoshii]
MLRDLLWFWDAKLNYDRGRAAGLAGLMGVVAVILSVMFWDKIYAVLDMLGIVKFLDSLGLVNAELTPLLILAGFFYLVVCLFIIFVVGMVILLGLILISNYITGENDDNLIKKIVLTVLGLPLYILIVLFLFIKSPRKFIRERATERRAAKEKNLYSSDQKRAYLQKNIQRILSVEEAKDYLNRLFIVGDKSFLMGHSAEENKMYILLPSPLYFKESSCCKLYGWQTNATSEQTYYKPEWSAEGYKDVYGFTGYEVVFQSPGEDSLLILKEYPDTIYSNKLTLIVEKDLSKEPELEKFFSGISNNIHLKHHLVHHSLVYLKEYNDLIDHISGKKEMAIFEKEPLEVIRLYRAHNHEMASLIYNDLNKELKSIGLKLPS